MLLTITYLIFSQLAVGGLISILLVPPAAGRDFFRFCGFTTLVMLALALLVVPTPDPFLSKFFLLLVLAWVVNLGFVVSVIIERSSWQKPLLASSGLAGSLGIVLDGIQRVPADFPAWAPLLTALHFLLSSLLLGSVVFAMVLGHYYLTVPTLAIRPLRSMSLLMVVTIIAKVLLLGITFFLFWTAAGDEPRLILASFFGLQGIFFWSRVLFGIVGLLVIIFMTWETVKIHSTQSATGLLYVATILVLIGEAFSRFIFYYTSIPV